METAGKAGGKTGLRPAVVTADPVNSGERLTRVGQVEPTGIEPVTSALRTQRPASASDAGSTLTAPPAAACTTACTAEPEAANAGKLDALAAELRKLSPADRARLAAMLLGQRGD